MKGTYILKLRLKKNSKIRIGKLGLMDFENGYYYYVGSAFGASTNLENRIKRHLRLNKEKKGKVRWHIDYFLVNPNASIVSVSVFSGKIECMLSTTLASVSKSAAKGFGCSDCGCQSHFYRF